MCLWDDEDDDFCTERWTFCLGWLKTHAQQSAALLMMELDLLPSMMQRPEEVWCIYKALNASKTHQTIAERHDQATNELAPLCCWFQQKKRIFFPFTVCWVENSVSSSPRLPPSTQQGKIDLPAARSRAWNYYTTLHSGIIFLFPWVLRLLACDAH